MDLPETFLHESGILTANMAVGQMLSARGVKHDWCSHDSLAVGRYQLGENTLVSGSVRFVHTALHLLGHPIPEPVGFDQNLRQWWKRDIVTTTVDEALRSAAETRKFIKPAASVKLFTGACTDDVELLDTLRQLDGTTPVFMSTPVNFLAEWRCYVTAGHVTAVEQYIPDFDVCLWPPPNRDTIDTIAGVAYETHRLEGFSVDVGILDDTSVAIVELNDGYALGSYGLHPSTYFDLLWARWKQLVCQH